MGALQKRKVAIIGAGGVANGHANGYLEHQDKIDLSAVCDVAYEKADEFAQRYAIPAVYADVEDMLAEQKPDLVSICTPPATHTELCIQCMEAGSWVLCEKPLCGSLADLDQIVDSEKQTGCYTVSVFQWRFGSAAQHLKTMFDQGALGKAFSGVCNTTWYRSEKYYQVPWRGTWKDELGGVTMGQGIHLIDLFLWIFGDWSEIKAMTATLAHDIEVEDVSAALVRFRNNAVGTILNSVACPRQETYLRLDFERATVEMNGLYRASNENWSVSTGELDDEICAETSARWQSLTSDVTGGHPSQIRSLLSDMDEGRRPTTTGPGIRNTLEFLSALYKSAFTNEIVRAGSIVPGDPYYAAIHGGADTEGKACSR